MKKITLALVAFMLVLGMTQCKKEQQNNIIPDEGETVYITMKVADDGGKHIVYPNTGAVIYSNGDKIYVGNNGHYVGTLTYSSGAFSGSITSPSTSDYLHFYFTGGKTPATNPTTSTTSFTVNIADQSSNLPVLSYGHSTTKYIDGTTTYTCMLENKCGLVKFVPSEVTLNPITVSGMKTTATIDFATPGITPTDATGDIILYSASSTVMWAILLPQEEVTNPDVSNYDFVSTIESVPAVTANMYYNTGVNISMFTVPIGAIASHFTINSSGDKVWFSKGNLLYIGSAGNGEYENPGAYWMFAENQWEIVSNSSEYSTEDKQVDRCIYCWATSGYHHGCSHYYPWSIYQENVNHNYYSESAYYAYGMDYTNLFDQTGQADWGYNAISNGGNQENLWRTPTMEEWEYVLFTRTTPSNVRFAKAQVIYNPQYSLKRKGIILLPDNWSTSTYLLNNTNSISSDFDSNIFTQADWEVMEDAGAVFLPYVNYRNNNNSVNAMSRYWSSTRYANDNDHACCLDFSDSNLRISHAKLSMGFAVRLVQDVE